MKNDGLAYSSVSGYDTFKELSPRIGQVYSFEMTGCANRDCEMILEVG